ncbi:la-related protein 7 [Rhipicephalus sanguineus]|uniref:la-related protein 7 n=1 Tax=Rhipicephalus sanguineus TaxID=34632 RepID=UPI001893B7FA|nr:la-related protein 7 [Rhipicephalus sanguineus]
MGEVAQSSSTTSLQDSSSTKSEKRKVRRRKKKLFKSIRDQMEFYFSDANLRKDRYMNDLVMRDEEGYVELEVFLTFHKIRALTSDVKDIAGAIATSKLLQMDEEHRRVRRCAEFMAKVDVDECTLYVERLPLHADHAWLKGVFSRHGQVVYVSLPRYRHNNRIKGFAFIEFATPEDVDRACQHFGYQDGSSRHPDGAAERTAVTDEIMAVGVKEEKSEDEDGPPAKRRREESSEAVGHVAFSKDMKVEEDNEDVVTTTDAESSDTGTARGELEVTGMEHSVLARAKRKKKLRKRKKKTQHSESKEQQPSLLVMPKCEWKRLRNKYLALQKATMAQIKRSLLLPPSGYTPAPSPSYTLSSPVQTSLTADSDITLASQEDEAWEMFSDDRGNKEPSSASEATQAPPALEFQPGVIVKLVTEKPVSNTVEFKNNIRQLANVAYVDVMEGDSVAYVRCADPEGAYQFIENQKESFCGALSLLTGDEEKSYWEKINLDRETRRNQKTRQKKRGVEKVMAKAQKMMEKKNLHIRFDDL